MGGTPSLIQFFSRIVNGAVLPFGLMLVPQCARFESGRDQLCCQPGRGWSDPDLALQDITRQLAAGALLLTLRPFEIGDDIEVKVLKVRSHVKLLTTVLRSDDGLWKHRSQMPMHTQSDCVSHSRYGMQRLISFFKIILRYRSTTV